MENVPIEEIRGPDHLCLLYTSSADQLAAVIPFVRTGLRRGERCLYMADENPAAIIENLSTAGISVEDAVSTGALVVLSKWDTYLRGGSFDAQAMLQFLQDQVVAAQASGFAALRVTGEVNWIETASDQAKFLQYEAGVNKVISQTGVLAMCQYQRDRLPPEMMLGILDTHPRIVEKHGINRTWELPWMDHGDS
jgi:chemotaxis family two-component system sensor kinase Cph1